jgi:signal transduction histidine kinase
MFRNLSLAVKLLVTILPLLVAIVIITVLDDHYQMEDMIGEAQVSAENYASLIRESLFDMMTSQGKIDDAYLERLNTFRDIKLLHIHFTLSGLSLRDTFLTDRERLTRLSRRELQNTHLTKEEKGIFSTEKTLRRQEGNEFHIVIPFTTTAKCQNCHNASLGQVLGIAEMDISLRRIESSIHQNYIRSLAITLFFTGIAIIISILSYRILVWKRLKKLVQATHVIGAGNLDRQIGVDGSNDELGELGSAFDGMRMKLKEAQEKLIHSEKLSIIGQMASSIIHDFRTPMSTINLAIESLEHEKGSISQRTKEWYRVIHDSIRQMVTMAQELLDFSRGEASLDKVELTVDDFTQQLAESVRANLARSKIKFETHSSYGGKACFDPDRMYRALSNLINNAQDAMPNGGKIDFTVAKENHKLVFTVADTGTGIAPEIRDTMFNAFVTAGKKKGTGLGLAITKRIVDQHGGTIDVESERGKGATFTVKIPLE